jgi:subtilisin family serine protease
VAPDVNLCTIKVLNVLGSGSFGDVITGILLAADMHADVINMSLGAHVDLTLPGAEDLVRALQAAVDFANKRGVIVVASAGNNGIDLNEDPFITLPAEIKGVVAVGATAPFAQQNFDNIASYSNFGGKSVDLFAPGGDFLPGGDQFDLVLGPCSQYQLVLPFACAFNDYLIAAGTSEAAPHVSGAAAVVESGFPGRQINPARLETCLESSAANIGPKRIFGAGRLDVLNALSCTFN